MNRLIIVFSILLNIGLLGTLINHKLNPEILTPEPIITKIDTRPIMTFDQKVNFKQACRGYAYEAYFLLSESPLDDSVIVDFIKNKTLMIEYVDHFDFGDNLVYIDLKSTLDTLNVVTPNLIAFGATAEQELEIEHLTDELKNICKELK